MLLRTDLGVNVPQAVLSREAVIFLPAQANSQRNKIGMGVPGETAIVARFNVKLQLSARKANVKAVNAISQKSLLIRRFLLDHEPLTSRAISHLLLLHVP